MDDYELMAKYNYYYNKLETKFGEQVESIQYLFEDFNNNILLDKLFENVIKILWQQKIEERKFIVLIFLLLENNDIISENTLLQTGGTKSLQYILFFSLVFFIKYIYSYNHPIQSYREPPRQSLPTIFNPRIFKDQKELKDDSSLQFMDKTTTELYNSELLDFLKKTKQNMYYLKFVNMFLDIVTYRTGNVIIGKSYVTIFKKIDNLLKANPQMDEDHLEHIQKSVIYGLKFLGLDINKLIIDSGITISIGAADLTGNIMFSDLLSKIISLGLSPELKFAFVITPIVLKSVSHNSQSLIRDEQLTDEQFLELISRGGGKRKTRIQKKRKRKNKKTKKRTAK
jgi:hypothetical protein